MGNVYTCCPALFWQYDLILEVSQSTHVLLVFDSHLWRGALQ